MIKMTAQVCGKRLCQRQQAIGVIWDYACIANHGRRRHHYGCDSNIPELGNHKQNINNIFNRSAIPSTGALASLGVKRRTIRETSLGNDQY